jgi:hypothetical protein
VIELAVLYIPLASYHVHRDGQNEINPGLAAEVRFTELRAPVTLAAGSYLNSRDKRTNFVQAVWTPIAEPTALGTFRAGLSAGVGTGYDSPVVGGAFVAIGHAHFTIVPPTSADNKGVVAFALRFDL